MQVPACRWIPLSLGCIILSSTYAQDTPTSWSVRDSNRFSAEEAHQAVAVDGSYFYAIANDRIGKYERQTGKRVASWRSSEGIRLTHLNSGLIRDGLLLSAHSNYPQWPPSSSVEIWKADTLEHIGNHSFGIYEGSLTWVDWHQESWWAVFAHYSKPLQDGDKEFRPQKDNRWTSLVQFDSDWRRLQAWSFPPELLKEFHPNSCSGGGWGLDGFLYCTGHDAKQLYRLALPQAGSELRLVDCIPVPITGQGFAWDRSQEVQAKASSTSQTLFGIDRRQRLVIEVELIGQEPPVDEQ